MLNMNTKFIDITDNQYQKLLNYPNTLNSNNVEKILVYQYYIGDEKIDCIGVTWIPINSTYPLTLNFSIEEFNKKFN